MQDKNGTQSNIEFKIGIFLLKNAKRTQDLGSNPNDQVHILKQTKTGIATQTHVATRNDIVIGNSVDV